MLLAFGFASFGQVPKTKDMKHTHKVIMQVTQGDSLTQLAVIGQVRNIKQQLPDARIKVVCHANSLDMLLKSGSKVASHIAELVRRQRQRVDRPRRHVHVEGREGLHRVGVERHAPLA